MATTKTTNDWFDELSKKLIEIIEKKKEEYGLSILVYRPGAISTRIYTKLLRVQAIQEAGENKVDESIQTTLHESLGYVLFRVWRMDELKPRSIDIDALKKCVVEIREIMIKKNHDYGEAWRHMRISDIADEALSKLVRIRTMENISKKDSVKKEELQPKIFDAIVDVYNYVIFALILIEEGADPML